MYRKSNLAGLMLAVLFLSGCVTGAPVIDADAVKGNGLLVGQITSNSFGSYLFSADVRISGKDFKNAIAKSYLLQPLEPGTYELEQIKSAFSTSSGNVTTTTTTRYPLKAKFTIRPGEVTNLGKVVLYFPDPNGKSLKAFFVDNREDMQAFLRKEHTGAYNALRDKQFRKADVTYANDKQVEALRIVMLRRFAKATTHSPYLAGDLGSLAKVVRNRRGRIVRLRFVKTGTYQNIGPCAQQDSRFACVVPHPTKGDLLYVAGSDGLHTHKLPAGSQHTVLELIGRDDIVLTNNRMEVYTSTDDGRSWSAYTAARLKQPVDRFTRPAFSLGKHGYYVYSKAADATILYRRYGAPSYEVIAPPQPGNSLRGLTETDKGLYADPEYTMLSDAEMFFKPNGRSTWAKHKIPSSGCGRFEVIDRAKDRIVTKCNNRYFVTDDHGKTWRQALRSELRN